ncbi:MAG: peptidase C39 family protein, partial [Oceanospirillum sp.]|nr:peptidase C39 family protein [Oceanospirillum sp.]
LLLFRRGTGLARLYSIAVSPSHQGQGIAGVLLETLEQEAAERHQVFMRLEVRQDNLTAIALYEKRGYRRFGMIKDYYEDGQAALRMEKRLLRGIAATPRNLPYYRQNTDFTCGPSALLMAMRALDSQAEMTLDEELQIWREATTIFMLSGHGGCSPHGLALSAWRRGFSVDLYVNTEQTPFIDSVRDEAKKQIMTQVHGRFMQDIERSDIRLHHEELSTDRLQQHLQDGASVISLISTWRFNRNKIPHWVTLVRADDAFMYLSDPEPDDDLMHTATDNIAVPVSLEDFSAMNRYGRNKLHCSLVLTL